MPERDTTTQADFKAQNAHDVLAAEAFAVPAPDPELHHHGPITLPADPAGEEQPHDVLAAEEFPMPALPPHPAVRGLAQRRGGFGRLAVEAAAGLVLAAAVLRRWRG